MLPRRGARVALVMAPTRDALVRVIAAVALFAAPAARAQVFSPGSMSKAHEELDGLGACLQCHVEGGKHDNSKCLECHKEIGRRIDAGAGYHNSLRSRLCAECHREHRGEKAKLIEWSPSRDAFNHGLTGWPLKGAHKAPACQDCHQLRRVEERVRALVTKTGRETYLGLDERCVLCHFDEHRGQEGDDCQRCHTTEEFTRAPAFNHNDRTDARFALVGKHKRANCKSCHEPLVDTKTARGVDPAPRDVVYLQLKDIPHASCLACHEDVHRGKLSKSCASCHTPNGWQLIKEGAQDTGFHDQHAFKLRGEHQGVACKSCHGPFPGQAAKFKGTQFARCADCHLDAHVGQLRSVDNALKCEKCHDESGFIPVLFNVEMHEATRFPLQASHRPVACNLCHKADARVREKIPSAVKRDVERKGLRLLVSAARLAMPDVVADALGEGAPTAASDCEACHEDTHAGQFKKPAGKAPAPHVDRKGCASCHAQTSFAELTFNHDDSRFPLMGKHKDISCGGCHLAPKGKDVVSYRPVSPACASCHADEHVGQLQRAGVTDCAACHASKGFKPATFDHDTQSAFPLEGRHREAKCVDCHRVVEAKGDKIARYRPLPTVCTTCHEDEHKHAFDDYDPTARPPAQGPRYGQRGSTPTQESRCDRCHTPVGWAPSKFAHERTGFPLSGRHATNRCATCHGNDFERTLPTTCAGCHQDPHGQEFGLMCSACHSTERFAGPSFPVDAHRRSNFPLTGRHAALPCDACHLEKRERTFARVALDCLACHAADAAAASLVTIDHGRPPVAGVSCSSCHVPVAFSPARFPQHELCFPLSRGAHAPVRCTECHSGLSLRRVDGSCTGVPVLCATCHAHRAEVENPRHRDVPGYEPKSEKCAGCHGGA